MKLNPMSGAAREEWMSLRLCSFWRKIEMFRRMAYTAALPLPFDHGFEADADERDRIMFKLTEEYLTIDRLCVARARPDLSELQIAAMTKDEQEQILLAMDRLNGVAELSVLAHLANLPNEQLGMQPGTPPPAPPVTDG